MYPASLDALVTDADPDSVLALLGVIGHTALHNEVNAAVNRVQSTLGLNPQGSRSTVSERIHALELSAMGESLPPDMSNYLDKTMGGTVTGATTFNNLTAGALTITGDTVATTAKFTTVQVSALQVLDGASYRALQAKDVGAIPVSVQDSLVVNNLVTEQALSGAIRTPKVTTTDLVTTNLDAGNATGVFTAYRVSNSGIETTMPGTHVGSAASAARPLFKSGVYAVAVKALTRSLWVTTSGLLTSGQPQIGVGVAGPYDSEAAAYGDWTAGASAPIAGTSLNFSGGTTVTPMVDYTGISANLGDFGMGTYCGQDWINGLTVGKWYLLRPMYRNLGSQTSTVSSFRMRVETSMTGEKSL